MPQIASGFDPPVLLRNPHVQTILRALLPEPGRMPVREQLELPDGDFLKLDWHRGGFDRLAILTHGLEGTSCDFAGLAGALHHAGWDVVAWNFRGCGGEENRLLRFYHSGDTEDLAAVIGHASHGYRRLALVGFSLGGNVTLKYLGEGRPRVSAAVAVSTPVDLASSARTLDQRPRNRLYLARFMGRMKKKMHLKASRFPTEIDAGAIDGVRTFAEFDDKYTSRLHGFDGAEDYWRRASAKPYLPSIDVPALLINAIDDPFLTEESFPYEEAAASCHFHLETPAHGGHLGFIDWRGHWLRRRIPEFLALYCGNSR